MHGERVGCGVIERPRHDAADAGLDPEDVPARLCNRGLLLGCRCRPAHALRVAGGARRVEHRQHRRQRRALQRRLARDQGLVVLRAGHVTGAQRRDAVRNRDFRRRRDRDHGDPGRQLGGDRRQQVGMADEHAGTAVGQDVGDLLGLEVPVDRHGVGAERLRGPRSLHEGDVVAHQDGDAAAPADTQGRERRRQAPPARLHGLRARAARAADHAFRQLAHAALPGRLHPRSP